MRVTSKQIALGVLLVTSVSAVAVQFKSSTKAHPRDDNSTCSGSLALFQVPYAPSFPPLPVPTGSLGVVVNIGKASRHAILTTTNDSAGACARCGCEQYQTLVGNLTPTTDTNFATSSSYYGFTAAVMDGSSKKGTKLQNVFMARKHSHTGRHYASLVYMSGTDADDGYECWETVNGVTSYFVKVCMAQVYSSAGEKDCDDRDDHNCTHDDD